MAKVFIEFSAGIGPLIRCLPISRELRKMGHEVRFFARDRAGDYMKLEGFEAIDLDPDSVALENKINPSWVTIDEFYGMMGFDDLAWLSDRQDKWQAALLSWMPDLIVADLGALSMIAARVLKIPLVTITQSCYHPHLKLERIQYWAPRASQTPRCLEVVNTYFSKSGVPAVRCFQDLHIGTGATVIPGFPEFDKLVPSWESQTVYAGPVLASDFGHGKRRPLHGGEPMHGKPPRLFCYTGRLRDWAGNSGMFLFDSVVSALKGTECQVVFSTGGLDSDLPRVAGTGLAEVTITNWIPMDLAYTRSDLVIHHGGHGSCMGLFWYGVPGLVLPTHTEREYNARMVQHLGCGRYISREDISRSAITETLHAMLEDPSSRTRVRAYREMLRKKYPNPGQIGADAIAKVIQA